MNRRRFILSGASLAAMLWPARLTPVIPKPSPGNTLAIPLPASGPSHPLLAAFAHSRDNLTAFEACLAYGPAYRRLSQNGDEHLSSCLAYIQQTSASPHEPPDFPPFAQDAIKAARLQFVAAAAKTGIIRPRLSGHSGRLGRQTRHCAVMPGFRCASTQPTALAARNPSPPNPPLEGEGFAVFSFPFKGKAGMGMGCSILDLRR
ncbi:MAG: hypothetical protein LBE62_09405 [Azonexus sp.]|jgi:hypothetical protein|nr:hypothetical protein [Azonexus sp.]